jgi:YhcH/YjgK/YiaL family protein
MVYDKIDNIEIYKGLSTDIYEALKFLQNATPDIAPGVYQITPRVKAIVSEYETKPQNQNGYEAHRQYIDIQYLITGEEKINSLPLEYLKETKAYKQDIDAAFYEEANVRPQELLMGNGYFAILYPQDGHMPQLTVTAPSMVKKVVIKVAILP